MPYDDTRLRREIGRYLRALPDRGVTERYACAVRSILFKFHAHCREQGVRSAHAIKRDTILSFMGKFSSWSGSYQRQAACAIRQFLNEYDNKAMRKLRIKTNGPSRALVDWLTPEETKRILETPMTPRESVLIGAGLLQGLRRIETIRMTVEDAENAVRSGILRVRGKGHKERAIPLQEQFGVILGHYVRSLELERGNDRETLLGLGRTRSDDLLGDFCVRFAKKFSFHTLRRTFGRNLWLLGTRLETISELLGHASCDMTRLYLGLNMLDMRSALSAYHFELPGASGHGAPGVLITNR